MRVLLSSNPYRDRGLRVALEARRILNNAGAETALCLPFAPRKGDRLDLPRQVKLGSMEEELKRADVLLCFGGDGTILHAARDATLHDVPILGVNMGSVGFMAELERGELSLLTLLAAVGGPVAYLIGERLGAITFLEPTFIVVSWMAPGWLVLMLFFHLLMGRQK